MGIDPPEISLLAKLIRLTIGLASTQLYPVQGPAQVPTPLGGLRNLCRTLVSEVGKAQARDVA